MAPNRPSSAAGWSPMSRPWSPRTCLRPDGPWSGSGPGGQRHAVVGIEEVFMSIERASLAFGVPDAAPGTLFVLSISSSFTAEPIEGGRVVFGRNWEEADV